MASPAAPAPQPPSSPPSASPPRHPTRTLRQWALGSFDYAALCRPRLPCVRSTAQRPAIFFGLNDPLPPMLALLMGFQHALAMVAGVITVPRILALELNLSPADRAYLTSSALVVSGLMTLIQIFRFRLVRGYYVGTGLISMSGVSFTFLPVAQAMFSTLKQSGFCAPDAACPKAYGRWLGTVMVGSLFEIAVSFLPHRALRSAFPPVVTGSTVLILGAQLTRTGLSFWAGGFAVDDFGAARWIGLGFFAFSIIIVLEVFGSPFMRHAQIMIALVAGVVLSAALGLLNTQAIREAPLFTFPLVRRFKLGFFAPALLPVVIAFIVSAVEAIGDITASCELSRVPTEGESFESRVQGGVLADGLNSLLAALLTSSPTITFSQNNAVIAMTRTASRYAGVSGALWLIAMGVVGKLGGVFVALPDAVLGGVTTFLFASVAVSGVRILARVEWNRRTRFILAAALGLGLGVELVPEAFKAFIPPSSNAAKLHLREGVLLVLNTGYAIGTLTATVLNMLLPDEADEVSPREFLAKCSADAELDTLESGVPTND